MKTSASLLLLLASTAKSFMINGGARFERVTEMGMAAAPQNERREFIQSFGAVAAFAVLATNVAGASAASLPDPPSGERSFDTLFEHGTSGIRIQDQDSL